MGFHNKHTLLDRLMERNELEHIVSCTAFVLCLVVVFGSIMVGWLNGNSHETKQECIKAAVAAEETTLLRYETFVELCNIKELEYEL